MNNRKYTVSHCLCIYAYSIHMQIVWTKNQNEVLKLPQLCFLACSQKAIYICFLNYQLLPVLGLGRVNF
jgi:hypothetical protein